MNFCVTESDSQEIFKRFVCLVKNIRFIIYIIVLSTITLAASAFTEKQCAKDLTYQSTKTFLDVVDTAKSLGNKWGHQNVLLVFDVDNTLLAMTQALGSDQWFDWQLDLLQQNIAAPGLTATNFQGILDNQALLWRIGQMRPPEKTQPALLQDLQSSGFTTLLLTSRGPINADITLKALKENNYAFKDSSLPPRQGFAGKFKPYDITNIIESGITVNDAINMELGYSSTRECIDNELGLNVPCFKTPNFVKYTDGIYLTNGQDKGAMLRSILHKSGFTGPNQFQTIIYVDDKIKYIQQMHRAFCNQPIELSLFHYTHEADRVEKFISNDKTSVIKKWQKIKELLKIINK